MSTGTFKLAGLTSLSAISVFLALKFCFMAVTPPPSTKVSAHHPAIFRNNIELRTSQNQKQQQQSQQQHTPKYAVVQVIASKPSSEYAAAIYGVNGRIQQMHEKDTNIPYDHVLLMCEHDDPDHTRYNHPIFKVLYWDCSELKDILDNTDKIEVWAATFYILGSMNLTQYDKIFVMDTDMVLLTPLDQMMRRTTGPAMATWGSFNSQRTYNSGSVLMTPSTSMYRDAIESLKTMQVGRRTRHKLLREAITKDTTDTHARSVQFKTAQIASDYSDQEFLQTFWQYTFADKYGPLQVLPYEYNVRFATLGDFNAEIERFRHSEDTDKFEKLGKGPNWQDAVDCVFGGYCDLSQEYNASQPIQTVFPRHGASVIHLTPSGKLRIPYPKCSNTHAVLFNAMSHTIAATQLAVKNNKPLGTGWVRLEPGLIKMAKEFCNITIHPIIAS